MADGDCRHLEALGPGWEQARKRLSRRRGDISGMIVPQDLDSVYTSYAWTRHLLIEDDLRISYSANGANDNPWIDSAWGRLKTELECRIIEAVSLEEPKEIINQHFYYWNNERRHSSMGNMPPKKYLNTLSTDGKIAAPN